MSMKKYVLLLMILLTSFFTNAQNNYYKLWLAVERDEVNHLPKSANKKVEEIYQKALQESYEN